MDLRRARTFVTVAELGTVSAASQRLRITQPALSRQISDFEQELGLKLFDRVGRRLLLTSDGEQLLSDCSGLLNYASAVGERARLLRHGDTGVLKVAAAAPNIESTFPNFLREYAKRFPNVQVKLSDALGSRVLEMLARGELHLAQSIAHPSQNDDHRFESMPLTPVDLIAVCHPRLSLGDGRTVDINRLAPFPLLLLDTEFVVRKIFDAACRLGEVRPKVVLESRAPHSLLGMAEAGHGVAIIAATVPMPSAKLRIFKITYQNKPLRVPLIILWNKGRPRTRYAIAFCEMLADYMRKTLPIVRPNAGSRRARRARK